MSKTSGKRSAHSLNSPEDEICDLFRLRCIHAEVFANLFDILDGLIEINVAVVAYYRDDVGSVDFGLSIGVAADAVDLLDEVHVLLLCVRPFTLECWMPVIVECCLQPEYVSVEEQLERWVKAASTEHAGNKLRSKVDARGHCSGHW